MPKPLVIVESPAKARTLSRFLGDRYRVEASYGHVRDLPESAAEVPKEIKGKSWGRLGVDTDGDFTPYYVVPADKKKYVQHLKAALKDASEVILATDPDREGESISWHLKQVLKPKVRGPPHRLPRDHRRGDQRGAAARRTRTSTRTWSARRRAGASSIGCTATRCRPCCGRRCRPASAPAACRASRCGSSSSAKKSAWRSARRATGISKRSCAPTSASSPPRWSGSATQRVATGKDFDAQRRAHRQGRPRARRSAGARAGRRALAQPAVDGDAASKRSRSRSARRRPSRPRRCSRTPTASSASRPSARCRSRSGCSRASTSAAAISKGLISYHRTDSTTLSDKALREAGQAVTEMYGGDYLQGPAPVPDQGAERAGSARGDPADRVPPHAAVARARARDATS